jgi:hypothetical protein
LYMSIPPFFVSNCTPVSSHMLKYTYALTPSCIIIIIIINIILLPQTSHVTKALP